MEPEKIDEPMAVEKYRAREAQHLEIFRATVAFEHAALKPPLLLNGGALVGVLTFLGNAWTPLSQAGTVEFAVIKWLMLVAMVLWANGLFFAAWATVSGYKSQSAFLEEFRRNRDVADGRRDPPDHMHLAAELGQEGVEERVEWKWGINISLICFGVGALLAVLSLM